MITKNVMFGMVLAIVWSGQLVGTTDKDEQKSAKILAQICTEYLASPQCSERIQRFMFESIQEIRGTLINKGHGDSSKLMDEIIADIQTVRGAFKKARMQQLAHLTPEQRKEYMNNTLSAAEYEQIAGLSIETPEIDPVALDAIERLKRRYVLLASEPSREMDNLFEKIFFGIDHTTA